jgi:signal transduction histidine kinase/CheY-like chemotaxis protein
VCEKKFDLEGRPMPLRAPLESLWIRGLITWLTYSLSGLLAVSLSAPSEHVSPLYLAAGWGLAFVLGWSHWMLVAVGLGACTVNVITLSHLAATAGWVPIGAMAVIGGLGAALQAWTASRLTRPRAGQPLTLDTPRQIGAFLMLAGPVACLINPTVSVGALMALGLLPAAAAPQAFVGWWAGDALGVLVGTPMLLTLVGQPHALWKARRNQVGIPLLVATVLLGMAVRQMQSWRVERESAVFNQDVAATTNAVNLRLNGYLDALAALNGVFLASDDVNRAEFGRASRYWLSTLKGIQGAGWNEHLFAKDLPAFEARQRADGMPHYKVFDTKEKKPPTGQELVALRYIEPLAGNEVALGFNILSNPSSRDTYEQARREGRVVASKGFQLMQEAGKQTGVVIYHPVFKGQPFTPQARVQANLGVVFLALRMDDALAAMLEGSPDYVDACLVDATEHEHPLLGGSRGCHEGKMGQGSSHRAVVPIDFAGRQWQLVIWNSAPVPVIGQGATTWMLAVGGVAFAAALGGLLLVMTGHTRRIEEAMEEARRQRTAAEEANRAKSEFLSRMSHELRTPLNAVLGFAQIMEMDQATPLAPSHSQRIEQIQQAGWHLLDMIDDVLDISRIDTGTMRLHAEPLRIRDELAKTVKLMSDDASQQGVRLVPPDEIPSEWGVTADAARLHQILSNLISNAIKFNQRGGQVNLKVSQGLAADQTPTLNIAVEDTGIGMNATQLAQLFQPFNRLGREQSTISGTGIGLVVSRHLALLMGGQIDVQSEEGVGSVFTLILPALMLPPRPRPASPTPPASITEALTGAAVPRNRHVLYVEDNLANSEVIRAALSARPWITVTVAPTTEEGLAVLHNRLRGTKPDLILLDVHLPDASGQELLKLIKANPDTVDIPVIMISADAMPEQIDAALATGAACYLTKPVQISALLRQVDELMPS